ncbi:MAG TPA: hypothetical protein VMT18_08010 [Planctomycetota bacterium]|nr:hypothetical protein [Planctomycetota bacterium]
MPRRALHPSVLLGIAYPLLVYLGADRFGVRAIGLAVLAPALVAFWWGRRAGIGRRLLSESSPLLAVAVLAALASATGDARLLLGLPVAINLGLFALFSISLLPGRTSLVGRFARAQSRMEALPATAESYCRKVTVLWCAFFLGNALVTALLALWGPLGWWAAYTGAIAYLLAGALMALEFLYRRWRVEPRVRRELAAVGPATLAVESVVTGEL